MNKSNTVFNFLYAVRNAWRKSGFEVAQEKGEILAKHLQNYTPPKEATFDREGVKPQDFEVGTLNLGKVKLFEHPDDWDDCTPPFNAIPGLMAQLERSKIIDNKRGHQNTELYSAFLGAFDDFPWKTSNQLAAPMVPAIKDIQNLKSAHLIGKPEFGAVIESNEFFLGTYYQAADTSYPGHAHEPEEMYHTLVGTTQWGESLEKLNWYGPDEFRHHPSCHPHAMVVPEKSAPLLAIYCWTGDVNGLYWYTE